MKRKSIVASAASVLLLAAMGANAGLFDKEGKDKEGKQAAGDNSGMFSALDANQDQLISPQEAESNADVAMSFGELDTNTDGHLSAEEFSEFSGIDQQQK